MAAPVNTALDKTAIAARGKAQYGRQPSQAAVNATYARNAAELKLKAAKSKLPKPPPVAQPPTTRPGGERPIMLAGGSTPGTPGTPGTTATAPVPSRPNGPVVGGRPSGSTPRPHPPEADNAAAPTAPAGGPTTVTTTMTVHHPEAAPSVVTPTPRPAPPARLGERNRGAATPPGSPPTGLGANESTSARRRRDRVAQRATAQAADLARHAAERAARAARHPGRPAPPPRPTQQGD